MFSPKAYTTQKDIDYLKETYDNMSAMPKLFNAVGFSYKGNAIHIFANSQYASGIIFEAMYVHKKPSISAVLVRKRKGQIRMYSFLNNEIMEVFPSNIKLFTFDRYTYVFYILECPLIPHNDQFAEFKNYVVKFMKGK